MKYLAGSIVFAAIVAAVIFRYDYIGRAGLVRVDRWTGDREIQCDIAGGAWMIAAQCKTENPFGDELVKE